MKKLAIIGLLFGLLLVGAIPNGLSAFDYRYASEWGGYSMSNDGEFFRPQYVAIDDDGNVYVTDLSSRVQKFTSDGTFLKSWGSMGPEDGQFGSPSGIAVFGDHVYVADKKQHSIDVFDKDGNFIFSWGEFGSGDGQFSKPHGVKINSDGIVFVADPGNHRIQKFTSDGEFLSAFGIFGMTDGKLKTPTQLAIDENSVFVADPGNLKIEKYTDEGIFLKTIDKSFAGSKIRPYDIVINSDGDIFVTDTLKHRIVKMSSDGRTLKTFGMAMPGNAGIEKNQFLEPIGITIDAKGYLLVVDSVKNRIVKFETPISKQIEEALTAEQVEKLKELSYTEESENKDTESVDQVTETTEQVTEPEQQFVHDTTKPLLQVPNDLVIESTGRFTQVDIGEAMAMDDNGIRLLINNSPKSFSLGIYQIIWTAVDNSGNSAFAIQEIHVVDTLPPVISQIQDKTLEAAVPIKNIVQLQAPSATDVSGVVSILSDAPEFFSIGETIVTWTATDVAGNESSIEQKVTIVDTTSPSLQIP
ncbi:MAG: HYR domain-containing protein, partial [Candidatus Nitrosopelagicus sp.]